MSDDTHHSDVEYLPDVTARWIGRIQEVDDTTLTVSITPRKDSSAVPVIRDFDRRHFSGRRTPRAGMHVAISEFDDGDIIIEAITHWWSHPWVDLVDVAVMCGIFLAALFS